MLVRCRLDSMADPVTARPEELAASGSVPRERTLGLLRRRDFRRLYLAVSASELGDAFHYIALMWFALQAGGPLGVMAGRRGANGPGLFFRFYGGPLPPPSGRPPR